MNPSPELEAEATVSGERFILQARECLEHGYRLHAGKKAWEAIAYYLEAIGESRGWRYNSPRLVHQIGVQIWTEYLDFELGFAITDVFYKGYRQPLRKPEEQGKSARSDRFGGRVIASVGSLAESCSLSYRHHVQHPATPVAGAHRQQQPTDRRHFSGGLLFETYA